MITLPRRALVHIQRNGHDPQNAPKRAGCWRATVLMAIVRWAGQVTARGGELAIQTPDQLAFNMTR